MSLNVEKLDGNMAKLTIELEAGKVEDAITRAYQRIKNQVSLPGFRKGKVPQKMVEKQYGVEVFYEDAANYMINDSYFDEIADCDLDIVSMPEIDVVQIERDKPFIYTALVAIKPEVELGKYKGIEYTAADTKATKAEVDKELEQVRELNSRQVPVEDRPAEMGDITNIDYEGFVDGTAFAGGKDEGYNLTLGSNTFIPGFEEQVAGHKPGEEFDVNVTFPAEYQAPDLAGKAAVFKCKLNEIKVKELPELDDEFAAEVSEFDTLKEYKASIKKRIEERKKDEAEETAKGEIVDKLIEESKMEIPAPMLAEQVEKTANDFKTRMQYSGIPFEQYLQMVGQSEADFLKEVEPVALKGIKTRLVLEAVAKAENIEVTEEDFNNEVKKLAENYQMDPEKFIEYISPEEQDGLRQDIAVNKASDFLFANAKAAAKKAEDNAEEKTEEKKPVAKKAPAKKPAEKAEDKEEKPAAKKAPAKKPAAKKEEAPAEEEKPAKKPAAKKTTTKKAADKE